MSNIALYKREFGKLYEQFYIDGHHSIDWVIKMALAELELMYPKADIESLLLGANSYCFERLSEKPQKRFMKIISN